MPQSKHDQNRREDDAATRETFELAVHEREFRTRAGCSATAHSTQHCMFMLKLNRTGLTDNATTDTAELGGSLLRSVAFEMFLINSRSLLFCASFHAHVSVRECFDSFLYARYYSALTGSFSEKLKVIVLLFKSNGRHLSCSANGWIWEWSCFKWRELGRKGG